MTNELEPDVVVKMASSRCHHHEDGVIMRVDASRGCPEAMSRRRPCHTGTAALEEYISNMSNDLRANQELIDEMRAMNSVLDEYFYRVAYSHFERQTSVALWPVKIGEQAEKAKDFCASIRAKYLQAQIGEQAAFADALNELQEFALSFDQYTSLSVCEEAAAKARDCMKQVEEAGEQARLFNARELLFEREVTVLTQRLSLSIGRT